MAPTIKGKIVQHGEHLKVKVVHYGEDIISVDYGEDVKVKDRQLGRDKEAKLVKY